MIVRPIGPNDRKLYQDILERTSEQDRYNRFFDVRDHLDPQEVDRFVVLPPEMIGYIALEGKRPLGAAHASLLTPTSAELAVVVASDTRRSGVGSALFTTLIDDLQARGCDRVIAYALSDNRAMARLAKSVGMHSDGTNANVVTWATDAVAA